MSLNSPSTIDGDATVTCADALVDLLIRRWGVRHIFGMPGDGINGVMESLRKRRAEIQFVQVRHEEAAAFAACAYAKFSGRLGVCLATSGPGAIHLLNGLYDARADHAPVLAITGLQFSNVLGTHYQQDFDTTRLMGEVAVYSEKVMQPAHLENVANLAARYALARRSVTHIAIPIDVQETLVSAAKYNGDQANHTSGDWTVPVVIPTNTDLERAAAVLNAGRKVAIMVGAGARGAGAEIEKVAELLAAPVGKALLGKDVLSDDSPYTTQGVALVGTAPSAEMLQGCDTLLLVGTSMPYTGAYPKIGSARSVQIDIDPARIGLRYPVEVALSGDAKETLAAMLPLLKRNPDRRFLESAQRSMVQWRAMLHEQETSQAIPMRPQVFANAISRHLADDAIICGDVGQNTHWLSRHIYIKGTQRCSLSGTLASMACGLPYAIGAQIAFPDRQVVAYVGDGGLTMLMGELATLVKYNLPVKVFVSKNNALGLIRWEQMLFLGHPEYGIELQDIDYCAVARACGASGVRVDQPSNVDDVVRQALATHGPVLIEGVVDPFEPVMPGHISVEQAKKYGEALRAGLRAGQPNENRIGLTMFRDMQEGAADNFEVLETALIANSPELLAAEPTKLTGATPDEPGATFAAQVEAAQERRSGVAREHA